jgi:hypothetical protein
VKQFTRFAAAIITLRKEQAFLKGIDATDKQAVTKLEPKL